MDANPRAPAADPALAMPIIRPAITYRALSKEVQKRLGRLSEMDSRHSSASSVEEHRRTLAWLAAVLAALAGLSR